MLEFAKIVGLSILAAVVYGIIHDQITARVCVEYFTIGHPPVFGTTDPTLLGFGWGIIATWWVGAFFGVLLAIAARAGSKPPVPAARIVRPLFIMLGCVGLLAIVAGIVGHTLAARGTVYLVGPWATDVPRDKHVAFLTDLWAHNASYDFGALGGAILCFKIWRDRRRAASALRESRDKVAVS